MPNDGFYINLCMTADKCHMQLKNFLISSYLVVTSIKIHIICTKFPIFNLVYLASPYVQILFKDGRHEVNNVNISKNTVARLL